MSGRGVIYIVFGEQARQAARQSIASLRTHCDLPVLVIGDAVEGADEWMPWDGPHPYGQTPQGIRFLAGMVKPSMYRISPFRRTLYVDADTQFVASPLLGFALLDRWEMTLSIAGDRKRWLGDSMFGDHERWETCELFDVGLWLPDVRGRRKGVGHLPYYNSGLVFWKRCRPVQRVFEAWGEEWQRYGDWDEQLALQRAVFLNPLKFLLLPDTWNNREPQWAKVVLHWYGVGAARSVPYAEKHIPKETTEKRIKEILRQLRGRQLTVTMDVGFGFNPRPADIYLEKYADNRSRMADLKLPEKGQLVWGDVEALRFPRKSVDFIHCHHVLEHVEHPDKACKELLRVGVAGHITAPDENSERMWFYRGDKPYHLWLIKQRGCKLHFYPRHRLGEIGQMEDPHRPVDLQWDADHPFEWVIEKKWDTLPSPSIFPPVPRRTDGPAPEHVVFLFEHVLGVLGKHGVRSLLLANDWYGRKFMQLARQRGVSARFLDEAGPIADMIISLMELQRFPTLGEAWSERDRLRTITGRLAVVVPYRHHFHGGDNVLQFDEISLQAPWTDTTMTGYLVGVW